MSNRKAATSHYFIHKLNNSSVANNRKHDTGINHENQDLEREILRIAGYVCEALQHLHSCGYLHGDIKSNSILIIRENSRLIPKITDYGKSCKISSPTYSCVLVKNVAEYNSEKMIYRHSAKEIFLEVLGPLRLIYLHTRYSI